MVSTEFSFCPKLRYSNLRYLEVSLWQGVCDVGRIKTYCAYANSYTVRLSLKGNLFSWESCYNITHNILSANILTFLLSAQVFQVSNWLMLLS